MSNRESAIELLNQVPEYKLGYVLAYIQGLMAEDSGESKAKTLKVLPEGDTSNEF